jgi:hypothetical protein
MDFAARAFAFAPRALDDAPLAVAPMPAATALPPVAVAGMVVSSLPVLKCGFAATTVGEFVALLTLCFRDS